MTDRVPYLAVIVSGAAVLAIELLGTRIFAPVYGLSLFLWATLISVTLAALSAGYTLGGRLADQGNARTVLGWTLSVAGIWTSATPALAPPALMVAGTIGLRSEVVLGALLLFGPSLTLLGMTTPLAIKIIAQSLSTIGVTTGRLFAISTAASVVSALAVGAWLIPVVGVNNLFFSTGIILLVTGLIAFGASRSVGTMAMLILLQLTAVAAAVAFAGPIPRGKGLTLVELFDSPYGEIQVCDAQGERILLIDGAIHSMADTALWRSSLEYPHVMEFPRFLRDSTGRALVIGLGAGSLVKQYWGTGWTVDAVEIDPVVADVAVKYFGLRAKEGRVFVEDGRRYLEETTERYDLILFDAFGSGTIPFHLTTVECFAAAKRKLNPGGIVVLNIWSEGWKDPIIDMFAATLRTSFGNVVALPIAEPPTELGNMILVASNGPLELVRELERDYRDPFYAYSPRYQRVHAWDNKFSPTEGGEIMTDDRNNVERMMERLNAASREQTRKR